jgi:molybdate transport system substrate-binding protein
MRKNSLSLRAQRSNLALSHSWRFSWIAASLSLLVTMSPAHAMETVTIMADSSMSVAMAQMARDYSQRSNVIVSTSFLSNLEQQQQINEGAAADVVVTPNLAWIEDLKAQGLVDVYSQMPIAKNQLALVGPLASPLNVKLANGFPTAALIQLFGWEQSFVIGSPDMLQEGVYAKEALRNLGVAGDLEEYTLYIKRLDQMFDMVENHNAYGIFFYSSTIGRAGIRVLDLFPDDSHKPIEYDAVVIAGDNMEQARKFIKYLQSEVAKSILRENGFLAN